MAVLLVIPGQPVRALGIELIVLAGIHGLALLLAGRRGRKLKPDSSQLARLLDRTGPNTITTLLVLAAGATMASGYAVGLYLLVAAVVLAIIGGVANAWIFLVDDVD